MSTMQKGAGSVLSADAPVVIEPRLANPAGLVPDALAGIQKLIVAVRKGGLPESTIELTHMRASQINGCSACIEGSINHAHKMGQDVDERLLAVAAWRHSSQFTEAERAALALTEAMTRLADRPDPVPDEIWTRAAEHFDEQALAALVLHVALTNLFNRLNVSTLQPAGDW
jgi:AhpD family alkylhydroperoxidase